MMTKSFTIVFLLFQPVNSLSQQKVLVCQNKDCQKRFSSFSSGEGGLTQMIADLLPPEDSKSFIIEASGCLSNCGKGPNVSLNDRTFNGVNDVQTAAAVLEVGGGIDCPIALMVAVDMIGQACRTTNEKKLKILTSVIDSLEKSNASNSNAMSHALINRADAHLDANNPSAALKDTSLAIEINHLSGRAFRAKADAHEALGNIAGASEAIERWAEVNPSFSTKAKKELMRLAAK